MTSRRDFLKTSALASAALMTPGFLKRLGQTALPQTGRRLVVIQLSGGNDGLNTVIPFQDDRYYTARPRLGIKPDEVIRLDGDLGLNPGLSALRDLYDQGWLSVINQVGYPNADRSHFRSMDIWHSASDSNEHWDSGWLGRYLDHSCSGCASPHLLMELDDSLSLAVRGETANGLAIRDPKQLYQSTQDPWLQALHRNPPPHPANGELEYLYKTLTSTVESAQYIYEKARIFPTRAAYPAANPLAQRLKLIAELIFSGLETQVFYVSLPGFDTHVRQAGQHERLLKVWADALAAFVSDLRQNDHLDNTLIMTFSEFGRRVEENAGGGTDHGKGSVMFLAGGRLRKPGIYNRPPDLSRLDDGDIGCGLDFRRVYANILHDWLEVDDQAILRRTFERVNIV